MVAGSLALSYCINMSECLIMKVWYPKNSQSVHEVNVLVYAQRTILKHIFNLSNYLNGRSFFLLFLYFIFHFRLLFSYYRGYILSTLPKWWCAMHIVHASGVIVQLRYRFIQFRIVIRFVEKCIFAAILKVIRGANGGEFVIQLKLNAVNTFTYLKSEEKAKQQNLQFTVVLLWVFAGFARVFVCVSFLPFSIFACSKNISAFRLCDKYYKPFCC